MRGGERSIFYCFLPGADDHPIPKSLGEAFHSAPVYCGGRGVANGGAWLMEGRG